MPPATAAPRPNSQSLPLLLAEGGLTQDGTHDGHGDVAGVHWHRSTPPVGVHVPGVAPALPAEREPGPLEFSDDLPSPERPKRHGEEALPAGRTLPPPSPRWERACPPGPGNPCGTSPWPAGAPAPPEHPPRNRRS